METIYDGLSVNEAVIDMLEILIDSGALVYIDPLMFLPVFGVIEGDIDLPSTIMEYHIDWTSSEPDIIAIDGTVNRPSEEVGDVVVLLTATFVIEDVVYSIEYEVTVTHLTIITYTSVEDLHSDFLIGDTVIFHGIVSGIFNGGYFLTDGTHAIGVYNPSSSLVFEIGDEVVVQGEYVVYHTFMEIYEYKICQFLLSKSWSELSLKWCIWPEW